MNGKPNATGQLTKDKVHVEELCLPEIMIPLTKTKGTDYIYVMLFPFHSLCFTFPPRYTSINYLLQCFNILYVSLKQDFTNFTCPQVASAILV